MLLLTNAKTPKSEINSDHISFCVPMQIFTFFELERYLEVQNPELPPGIFELELWPLPHKC